MPTAYIIFDEGEQMPKKVYFFYFVCAVNFCINAMDKQREQWKEKSLAAKNILLDWDKKQREQLCQEREIYRGELYQKLLELLNENKQKAKSLKKNAIISEYELYKRSYRSCPNRATPYPQCPGNDHWRDCPTCYPIFKNSHKGTQQYIFQKKIILQEKWSLYVMYNDKINLKNYYCDIENCQYKAKQKGHLKLHKANIHNIDVTWYHCDIEDCEYKAKQKRNLKQHKENIHKKNIIRYQ